MYVCMYVHVCVYMCMCICVCVYVCVFYFLLVSVLCLLDNTLTAFSSHTFIEGKCLSGLLL